MNRRFEKYRPPKPSNRLEPLYSTDKAKWMPSTHYKFTVHDIRNQLTPAEYYRARLVDSGTEIRAIHRLEWRIQKNPDGFLKASLKFQSLYRGFKGRQYFNSIKVELKMKRLQRDAENSVKSLMKSQTELEESISSAINEDGVDHTNNISYRNYENAIEIIDSVPRPTVLLLVMKAKMLYRISKFNDCEIVAREVLDLDNVNEDGYFLLACSLIKRNKFEQAYEELKLAFALLDEAGEHIVRLNAFICPKLNPPIYDETFDNCNHLVTTFPEDMNALLQRGCSLSCLQDWNGAIEDFTLILYYQPDLPNVLCLRARAYCCIREWQKSKDDYNRVMELYPDYATAWYGLQDVDQAYSELPMIDENLVNDFAQS